VREIQFRRQETKRKPGKKNQKPGIFASIYRMNREDKEKTIIPPERELPLKDL